MNATAAKPNSWEAQRARVDAAQEKHSREVIQLILDADWCAAFIRKGDDEEVTIFPRYDLGDRERDGTILIKGSSLRKLVSELNEPEIRF